MREEVFFDSNKSLENWLEANYERKSGIWLVYYKPTTKKSDLAYSNIVDTLLCYGWIDSLPNKVDEERTKIWITPRNAKSNWSRINKEKIARLEALGKMHKNGVKMIELAKQTGTWDALNDVENLVLPSNLQDFLASNKLLDAWEAMSRSKKRGYLEILLNAKRNETRKKRMTEFLISNNKFKIGE